MLIRFNVRNFLSIYTKQEFSMLTGNVRGKNEQVSKVNNNEILKYSSIYGANASGKSNLVKAIRFAQDSLVHGFDKGSTVTKYCKLKQEYKTEESYFDFEIIVNGISYSYGFTMILSLGIVIGEWLYQLKYEAEPKLIFMRDLKNNSFDFDRKRFNKNNHLKFQVWMDDSLRQNDVLFLNNIFNKNNTDTEFEIFNNIFNWFKKELIIIFPNSRFGSVEDIIQNDTSLLSMLESLDTGIKSMKLVKTEIHKLPEEFQDEEFLDILKKSLSKSKGKTKRVLSNLYYLFRVELDEDNELLFKKIVFKHSNNENTEYLDFIEESDGTRRIIELLQAINICQKKGKTIIVDEIERSLHPLLTEAIIYYYLEKESHLTSQLIITTHDERLLNLKKIRKDAFWFVEKCIEGFTTLKSLDEYKLRNDIKLDKAYLEGRLGAVPIISSLKNNFDDNLEDEIV